MNPDIITARVAFVHNASDEKEFKYVHGSSVQDILLSIAKTEGLTPTQALLGYQLNLIFNPSEPLDLCADISKFTPSGKVHHNCTSSLPFLTPLLFRIFFFNSEKEMQDLSHSSDL